MILKSFFRRKTTRVYLSILTILLATILVVYSFINYYENIQDDIYSKRSIVVMISQEDHYSKLKEYSEIKNIVRTIVFKFDKSYKTIIDSGYSAGNSATGEITEYNPDNWTENSCTWDVLSLLNNNDILVYSDKNNITKLRDNEIAIGIDKDTYEYNLDSWESIIGQPVGFYFNGISTEYTVAEIYETTWPELTISENLYDKLYEESYLYVYTGISTSYQRENEINENLKSLENNDDYQFLIHASYQNQESNTLSNLLDMLDMLKLIIYVLITIFFIIIFVVSKNILSDSEKNIILERRLGSTKLQIKIELLLKIFSLSTLAFIIAILTSYIVIILINNIWNLDLALSNLITILILLSINFIIDLISVLLKKCAV